MVTTTVTAALLIEFLTILSVFEIPMLDKNFPTNASPTDFGRKNEKRKLSSEKYIIRPSFSCCIFLSLWFVHISNFFIRSPINDGF
jgi:hypothetical protein